MVTFGAGNPESSEIARKGEKQKEKHTMYVMCWGGAFLSRQTGEAFAFCHKGGVDEGSQTWSHFPVQKLFQDYRIESKRGNKIDLEALALTNG